MLPERLNYLLTKRFDFHKAYYFQAKNKEKSFLTLMFQQFSLDLFPKYLRFFFIIIISNANATEAVTFSIEETLILSKSAPFSSDPTAAWRGSQMDVGPGVEHRPTLLVLLNNSTGNSNTTRMLNRLDGPAHRGLNCFLNL